VSWVVLVHVPEGSPHTVRVHIVETEEQLAHMWPRVVLDTVNSTPSDETRRYSFERRLCLSSTDVAAVVRPSSVVILSPELSGVRQVANRLMRGVGS